MTKRFGMGNKKVIKARDLDGDGKKSSYEMARAKGMAKGMGARFEAKKSGKSRPGKGTVTDKALKRSAKTAKKA